MKGRIIQFSRAFEFAHSVTNCALDLWRMFAAAGYESLISCDKIYGELPEKDSVVLLNDLKLNRDDVLIYHACSQYASAFHLAKADCFKILLWHNETPAEFFLEYMMPTGASTRTGTITRLPPFMPALLNENMKSHLDVLKMPGVFKHAWTDSSYNVRCLQRAGFEDIDVLPLPYKRTGGEVTPTASILKKYADMRNIIFVGRVVANKKQADIIRAFAFYHRIVPKSHLFLVGGIAFSDDYRYELLAFAESLGLRGCVHIPGTVSNEDLEAYWQSASLFLSMSEHEGFCIPVMEAFAHSVPVMAYASSAVPETVGDAGIVFNEKNFVRVAETMNAIIENPLFTGKLIAAGRERIKTFAPEVIAKRAVELLEKALSSK